jgi:hypothetical protein
MSAAMNSSFDELDNAVMGCNNPLVFCLSRKRRLSRGVRGIARTAEDQTMNVEQSSDSTTAKSPKQSTPMRASKDLGTMSRLLTVVGCVAAVVTFLAFYSCSGDRGAQVRRILPFLPLRTIEGVLGTVGMLSVGIAFNTSVAGLVIAILCLRRNRGTRRHAQVAVVLAAISLLIVFGMFALFTQMAG